MIRVAIKERKRKRTSTSDSFSYDLFSKDEGRGKKTGDDRCLFHDAVIHRFLLLPRVQVLESCDVKVGTSPPSCGSFSWPVILRGSENPSSPPSQLRAHFSRNKSPLGDQRSRRLRTTMVRGIQYNNDKNDNRSCKNQHSTNTK